MTTQKMECPKCKRTSDIVKLNERCPFCTPANEWREEFEKEFPKSWWWSAVEVGMDDIKPEAIKQIKDFIQNLLTTHSARLVERLESMRKKEKDEERDVILDNGAKVRGQTHYPQNVGWNQALDQAIDIVKSQYEKEIH